MNGKEIKELIRADGYSVCWPVSRKNGYSDCPECEAETFHVVRYAVRDGVGEELNVCSRCGDFQ